MASVGNRRNGPGSCFLKVRHYKRHITHENKAVSYKNHGLWAFDLGCRAFILKKKKKKKKKMEKIAVWPISVYTVSDGLYIATLWVFLGSEALEDHSQLPKKANKCSVGAVASFSYVWRHRHVRVIPT